MPNTPLPVPSFNSSIWTPSKKISDEVKDFAMTLFVERWKALDHRRTIDAEDIYRECVAAAKQVEMVNEEER